MIITVLDRTLRIRHEKEQTINKEDYGSAITEIRILPEWLVSTGWTDLCRGTDALANNTFEGVKGKGREIMSGVFAWLMPHYPFPIAFVVDFPEAGNSNHVFGLTKRKPLKANRQPIHRDNLEKYPDGAEPVSENTIIGLIKIKGLPLARSQLQQGKDLIGETDSVLEEVLSEINSRENQNKGTKGKARAGCMAAIALIQDLFQWLSSQQGKPEYS